MPSHSLALTRARREENSALSIETAPPSGVPPSRLKRDKSLKNYVTVLTSLRGTAGFLADVAPEPLGVP